LKIISESVRRPLLLRKRPGKQARNQGGFAPPYKFFRPSWKYVLDILWNYWTCSKKIRAPLRKLFASPGFPSWLRAC